ncbi:MAG: winged helix-turn-helix domain-containing protein [Thermodesulfobacteriota bacterium]
MAGKTSKLTQTSEKIGRALGRSSFKAEAAGQAAKEKVEGIVGRVTKRQKEDVKQSKVACHPFYPGEELTVEEKIGQVAGAIYHYLQSSGQVSVDKVVEVMAGRQISVALCQAALGWLAREDKVSFAADGGTIRLI